MASTKKLLTINEVAQMTGRKPKIVWMKAWRRELEFVKLGRRSDSARRLSNDQ